VSHHTYGASISTCVAPHVYPRLGFTYIHVYPRAHMYSCIQVCMNVSMCQCVNVRQLSQSIRIQVCINVSTCVRCQRPTPPQHTLQHAWRGARHMPIHLPWRHMPIHLPSNSYTMSPHVHRTRSNLYMEEHSMDVHREHSLCISTQFGITRVQICNLHKM